MDKPAKLATTSIILNVLSLLVYTLAVSNAIFQEFTLATEILALMGVINLTLSVIALTQSLRREQGRPVRRLALISLAVAIGMLLVIGILLLNIWVTHIRM